MCVGGCGGPSRRAPSTSWFVREQCVVSTTKSCQNIITSCWEAPCRVSSIQLKTFCCYISLLKVVKVISIGITTFVTSNTVRTDPIVKTFLTRRKWQKKEEEWSSDYLSRRKIRWIKYKQRGRADKHLSVKRHRLSVDWKEWTESAKDSSSHLCI